MKKYSMIPINRRIGENGERIVRRVLISYRRKDRNGKYCKCKLLAKDPYFDNPESSHHYLFTDKGFSLIKTYEEYDIMCVLGFGDTNLLHVDRPYMYDAGKLFEKSFEFKADTDEEAIKYFKERDF